MEYSVFLEYALPIFGGLIALAFLIWTPLIIYNKITKNDPPGWAVSVALGVTTFSIGAAFLLGMVLPFGSPY